MAMNMNDERAVVPVERYEVVIAQHDLDMYRQHFCPEAPENEWQIFVQKCKLLGLNPMLNEVYLVGRNTKVGNGYKKVFATQVSITGLISLAERTHRYEGHTKAEYFDADLKSYDIWPTSQGKHPYAIRIGVYKKGWREASYAIVYFHERAQYYDKQKGTLNHQWEAQGIHMHLKCALAAALRWAFQETCGGVYIHEEMGTADQEAKDITIVPSVVVEEAPDAIKATAQLAQVKQSASKSHQEAQQTPVPTSKELYSHGVKKGVWTSVSGYCAFASVELGNGIIVTKDTVLTADQKLQIWQAIEKEPVQETDKAS